MDGWMDTFQRQSRTEARPGLGPSPTREGLTDADRHGLSVTVYATTVCSTADAECGTAQTAKNNNFHAKAPACYCGAYCSAVSPADSLVL